MKAFSQEKLVEGLVFSQDTKERIAKVSVRNLRNAQLAYNNLKAEFKIAAQPGDVLVFSKQGYFNDTVKVLKTNVLAVYLKPSSIMLKEVNIKDTLLSPQRKFAQTQRDYSKIYGSLSNRSLLTMAPGVGAGISIDAIWNMISRSGRNAAHLKELIERDYRQDVVDYRFSKTFVKQTTGLDDPQLTEFMTRFRPSYYLITTLNDYDFIIFVKANAKRFLRSQHTTANYPSALQE